MRKGQSFFLLPTAYCLLLTIHLSLVTVSIAFAAEGGEHSALLKDWLWPLVNFAILLIVLIKFTRKPFKEFLKKRTELIEKSLKESEEARELSSRALAEVQERLKSLDDEINKILESAVHAGEREKEALIAQGESLKKRLIEQASVNIEQEIQKAKNEIKAEAALMAIELAEKQIKDKLGQKEQETLIDGYIKRLEAKN
ncbi:MAG: F0F1 ATP synthase subunit B [Nitrospirae bacterium]|nr:F0F1 ATP synthase subunit B [Nitrospirota bacterium]